MTPRSLFSCVVVSFLLAAGTGRAEPPSYWMYCYGGALDLSESTDPAYFIFKVPTGTILSPGECRWPDRPFRWGETGNDPNKGIVVFKGTPFRESLERLPGVQPVVPTVPGVDGARKIAPKEFKKLLFDYARDVEPFQVRVFREETSAGRIQFVFVDVRR